MVCHSTLKELGPKSHTSAEALRSCLMTVLEEVEKQVGDGPKLSPASHSPLLSGDHEASCHDSGRLRFKPLPR